MFAALLILGFLVSNAVQCAASRICDDSTFIKHRFDLMFPEEAIANALGPYRMNGDIYHVYTDKKNSSFPDAKVSSLCPIRRCPKHVLLEELYNLIGGIPTGAKLKSISKLVNISYEQRICDSFCRELESSLSRHSDTLLAITTLNHFDMTAGFISGLDAITDKFDLLFIDDDSSDGTAAYLIKKVLFVADLQYCQ